MQSYESCAVCGTLPEELTVNYGREMPYPEAYHKLVNFGDGADAIYKFCPSCKTYFFCVDYPQEYGSGNNAELIITRFSQEQSRYLDTMLHANEFYSPRSEEVDQILKLIPRHQVIFALYGLHHNAPKAFEQFIPAIVSELSKHDDLHWWDLVKDYYIGDDRQRADRIVKYFSTTEMLSKSHVKKMVAYCAQVQAKSL